MKTALVKFKIDWKEIIREFFVHGSEESTLVQVDVMVLK